MVTPRVQVPFWLPRRGRGSRLVGPGKRPLRSPPEGRRLRLPCRAVLVDCAVSVLLFSLSSLCCLLI